MTDNRRTAADNPAKAEYWRARGFKGRPPDWQRRAKWELEFRSRTLNPRDDMFWLTRGFERRPPDWRRRLWEGDPDPE